MKHVRKPIALLLALVLAASLLCLPALAADTVPARYARYRGYTCLGDSNAAGYAAEGYKDQPCTVTPGAYHSMVAGDLGAKLNARGWGGFRSHEMRHLLDPDLEITDWEYADNCAGYVQYNDLESRRDIYIQAVEEADLITVNIGSTARTRPFSTPSRPSCRKPVTSERRCSSSSAMPSPSAKAQSSLCRWHTT